MVKACSPKGAVTCFACTPKASGRHPEHFHRSPVCGIKCETECDMFAKLQSEVEFGLQSRFTAVIKRDPDTRQHIRMDHPSKSWDSRTCRTCEKSSKMHSTCTRATQTVMDMYHLGKLFSDQFLDSRSLCFLPAERQTPARSE